MSSNIPTRRFVLLASLATAVLCLLPAAASAAPALQLTHEFTSVQAYPGGAAQVGNILVKNVGDATVPDGSVTVTATVPPPLEAISASDPFLAWSCAIAPDGHAVTCTGPSTGGSGIPAGEHACQVFGPTLSCPIMIGLKADPQAPKGIVDVDVEACGGGALSCASFTAPIKIKAFGDDFGLAPINDGAGPADDSIAFGSATSAFWAGACNTAAAPPLGEPIGGTGVGARPPMIPVIKMTPPFEHVLAPAPDTPPHCIDWGAVIYGGGIFSLWDHAPAWRLPAENLAGSHPDGTASMLAARQGPGGNRNLVDGAVDNIIVDLPPGFVGNPEAVPTCTNEQFSKNPTVCPPEAQVGLINLDLSAPPTGGANLGSSDDTLYPIWNLEPRPGRAAEFGFSYVSNQRAVPVRLTGVVRTGSDRGITAMVGQIPAALPFVAQAATLWGTPWEAANDKWRAPANHRPGGPCGVQVGTGEIASYIPWSGFNVPGCAVPYDPAWGPIKPFLNQETDCNQNPVTTARLDAYSHPGSYDENGEPLHSDPNWKTYDSPSPAVIGCEALDFSPSITLEPTKQGEAVNQATDSASGLDVELTIPQNNDLPFDPPPDGAPQVDVEQYVADATAFWDSPAGRATAHLRDTTVTLPEGMTLNPAAADGQSACSMAQMGLTDLNAPAPPKIRFDNDPVACPDSSKVADVVVETPVLSETDWPRGSVYLAEQGKNPFGSDFAIYIVVESPERGIIVKLAGRVTPDPGTGRLTTTVAENPELPFDTFRLRFKAGPRAALATPVTCGTHSSTTVLTPFSDPSDPVSIEDPFQLTGSPAGACAPTAAARPFSLGFDAGSSELVAGSHSPFTVRLTRGDGNQELDRIEVTTPEGLVAKLAGVPYCPEAGIARATSRTATGDGVAEQADPSCPAATQVGTTTIGAGAGTPFFVGGKVYLAGPYKGAPVSLAFIVPAVAGPFDLGVQVVRTALNVNPKTAQVTAVSDTIPKILRGVPLRIRDIRVNLNRPGFVLNPTDCSAQQVTGTVFGASGAVTSVSNRFQIAECNRLGFKPNLKLTLFGGTKRGKYQRLKAVVTARSGDANIARASVTLPPSEFLAQEHIRTICTRVQFAADACPPGSVYGKATAISPLLDAPLSGPVYLRSSDNLLPDLVAALKGPDHQPIEVELSGRTDSKNKGIRNTFDIVPDAPVSKFTLELMGGKKSLIVNSTNICKGIHRADVQMDAQNGRSRDFKPKVTNPACGKARKGKKAGKKGSAKKRMVAKRSLAALARGLF